MADQFLIELVDAGRELKAAYRELLKKERFAEQLIEDGRSYFEELAQLNELKPELQASIERNMQDRKDARAGRLTTVDYKERQPSGLAFPANELVYDVEVPNPRQVWRAEEREHRLMA